MSPKQKSPESCAAEGLLCLKASSSNWDEVKHLVAKDIEELPAEFEELSLGEKSPDPFITIYADESCKDSSKLRYNPKTQEFSIPDQYEQNEEILLAEVQFNPYDTVEERRLKLQKIKIKQKKDDIKQKKDLILKWIAIHSDPFWKELFPEENLMCRKCSYYIRVQSAEEHLKMLKYIVEKKRKKKCIQHLKEAISLGCNTVCEAYSYFELKRKNSLSWLPTAVDLLPEWEITRCNAYKLELSAYMEMQIFMRKWIQSGEIKKKSDAHSIMGLLKFTAEQIDCFWYSYDED